MKIINHNASQNRHIPPWANELCRMNAGPLEHAFCSVWKTEGRACYVAEVYVETHHHVHIKAPALSSARSFVASARCEQGVLKKVNW
jgi:hypothetical protein